MKWCSQECDREARDEFEIRFYTQLYDRRSNVRVWSHMTLAFILDADGGRVVVPQSMFHKHIRTFYHRRNDKKRHLCVLCILCTRNSADGLDLRAFSSIVRVYRRNNRFCMLTHKVWLLAAAALIVRHLNGCNTSGVNALVSTLAACSHYL